MSQPERQIQPEPRVQSALDELQAMIATSYPSASFEVSRGEDPEGFYLTPTVDVEDPLEVYELVKDRLFELQVDDGLDVYVTPVRPIERVLEEISSPRSSGTHGRNQAVRTI